MENLEDLLTKADQDDVTILAIGDPHFKHKNIQEGKAFIDAACAAAKTQSPTAIVILGDILDTHEVVRVQPHNIAFQFISQMASIAHTYVLIGNHDYINNSQFLTDNHIFNPLKEKENITIVDKAILTKIGDHEFVMCPYVPPGKFRKALETLLDDEKETLDEVLANVRCIFAHQEFKGCKMGAIISEDGDDWDPQFPPIVSGHIHDSQVVGSNIYYPGSSMQHSFGESPDKRLWYITFNSENFGEQLVYEKIDLGLKGKKTLYFNISEIEKKFDMSLVQYYSIRVVVTGTIEELKLFRKGKTYSKLISNGVKVSSKPQDQILQVGLAQELKSRAKAHIDFDSIFKELVYTSENEEVRNAYKDIFGSLSGQDEDDAECELIFHDP